MRLIVVLLLAFSLTGKSQSACQEYKHTYGNTTPINRNSRADTIQIFQTHLKINARKIESKEFYASATITFQPNLDSIKNLNLDIEGLKVDSVFELLEDWKKRKVFFKHQKDQLQITPNQIFNKHQSYVYKIYYHGSPKEDASSWGGFHFQEPYYYNLGVGFASNPHVYGRSWFPCIDNFSTRSNYIIEIETPRHLKAICNGTLSSFKSYKKYNWQLWTFKNTIPSYLVSLAIAPYHTLSYKHNNHKIELSSIAKDKVQLEKAFKRLPQILDAYEHYFGPYVWEKVGYVLTPKGAMEHATSIHFPIHLVYHKTGESVIAHELAHHWWGNLITCKTAEDMWINEGMAEWASHLYLEYTDGHKTYIDEVQENALLVIEKAHQRDGDFLPIYGLPNELTYGMHTYQKGAMVAHNLRGYLGDSLFFYGLKQIVSNNSFKNISISEFHQQLETHTQIQLDSFFNQWIYNYGYPIIHQYIENVEKNDSGYTVSLHVKQTQYGTTSSFYDLPIYSKIIGNINEEVGFELVYKKDSTYQLYCPFKPKHAVVYPEGKILTGSISKKITIQQDSLSTIPNASIYGHTNLKDDLKIYVQYSINDTTPTSGNMQNPYWLITGYDEQSASFDIVFKTGAHHTNRLVNVYYKMNYTDKWKPLLINNSDKKSNGRIIISKPPSGYYQIIKE